MPGPARVLLAEIACISRDHSRGPLEWEGLSAHRHGDTAGASSMKSVCSPGAFISMQNHLHGDSGEEGAALHLGSETPEDSLPFCFPCGHHEITQPEPENAKGALVGVLCGFWSFPHSTQYSWIALTCFCSLGSSCCWGSFCSLSSCSPPPSLDLPCQMDFDCLQPEIKRCSLSLEAVFVVPGLE